MDPEVAPVAMGEDPWGCKATREDEWQAILSEEARKIVIEEDSVGEVQGGRLV